MFLLLYRAKVQGITQSQEGNIKKIPLSVKQDKTRLIIHKLRAKINLGRHIKTKEEFQQPKGKGGRCQIFQNGKIKARHRHMEFERGRTM